MDANQVTFKDEFFQTSTVMAGDDRKLQEEVRRLQAEVNALRSENSQLKVSLTVITVTFSLL